MMSPFRVLSVIAGGLAFAAISLAQMAISTHSGLVQLTVGGVFLDDQPLHKTPTNMVEVKPGQVLRTSKDGNAEVLLTPGVFLRLGNDSSIRMDANSLSDTKVTILSGSSMVECDELLSDNAVSFTVGKEVVQLRKRGLFRLEADPPAVGVVKGEAYVAGDFNEVVKQGKLLQFDSSNPQPVKFHQDKHDDLVAFSKARSADSAYATGVTSSSLYSAGYTGCSTSSWYLMGGVGMYSYLPCNGMFTNPYGLYMLGLNNGYMWMGPTYYIPPYALYGGYPYGYAPYVNSGGGGALPSGKTTGKTPTPAVVNSLVHGSRSQNAAIIANGQPRIPLFGTYNGQPAQSMLSHNPAFAHNAALSQSNSMNASRNIGAMAGPSMGRSAAMGAGHYSGISSGGNGGGYRGYSGPSSPPGMSAPAMAHSSSGMSSAGGHSMASAPARR